MSKMLLPPFSAIRFSVFSGALCKQPPNSRVAFCILSTSGESDEKYSACLALFHCELSGIKAAPNARRGILEQHGQESLDSVDIKFNFNSLSPVGCNTGKSSCLPPANWILLFVPSILEPMWFCYDHIQGDQQGFFVTSQALVWILSPPTIII